MRHYDIAVVGADFGGLAAAALLGMKGRKSFVCTPCASLPDAMGRAERDGFSFSRGPALSYGFDPGGAFHQLLSDLNITDLNPVYADGYQVVLPDRRITLSTRQDATLEEIRREFPGDISNAANFYRDIREKTMRISKSRLAAYFSRIQSARTYIAKYHFSNEFLSFLDIQARYFFQRSIAELSINDLLALCTHRPFRSYNVFEKIADQLAAMIVRQGGAVQYDNPSAEIVFRSHRAAGIQTAADTIETHAILLDKSETRRTVLYLGINDQVVPVGMERDVLYLPDYAQPQNFLSLSLSAKDDSTAAPTGMRALTSTFHASMNLLPADKDLLISPLAGLMPFLRDFLKVTILLNSAVNPIVPKGISFKPLRCGKGEPLLFKGSMRNLYEFHEVQDAPLKMMPAIRKLVRQIE